MTYYLLQAILVSVWWIGITTSPRIYSAFEYIGITYEQFSLFLFPDLVVIAGVSALAWRRPTIILRSVLVGAFAYASLWCIAAAWTTNSGYLGSTLMFLGLMANIFALNGSKYFSRSSNSTTFRYALETIIQSFFLWILFLVMFPILILKSFGEWPPSWDRLSSIIGALMFAAFSAIGVLSARALVKNGEGTPLPLNATKKLVVTGPYKYVRNPMAIAGLGQGLAVSIIFQSIEVAMYCILGMVVWNYLVRPVEEEDLKKTFGHEFNLYSAQVSCWIPRGGK
jgi:protein-S-isoprenylcysteine O-methyltransferase Ste14